MPRVIRDPKEIDGPVIVKYAGAKGGRGYFLARDYRDFRRNVDIEEELPSKNMCLVVDIISISSLIQLGVMGSKYKGKERMLART